MMLIQDSILFSTFSKIHLNPQAHSLFMAIFQAHYKYSMVINLKVCPFSVLGSLPPIYISSLSIPLFKLFSYIRITLLNPKGFYFFPSIFKFLFSPTSLSEHVRFTKLQCSVFSQCSLKGVSGYLSIPKYSYILYITLYKYQTY